MPHEMAPLTTGILVALSLSLLVPKRGLTSVPTRLRRTWIGDRHHVFDPPVIGGPGPHGFLRQVLCVGGQEWRRTLELGMPLWIMALVVEAHGTSRRMARERRWSQSPAGLMFARLTGELSGPEMEMRLRALGEPLPAEKARWDPPRQHRTSSVDEWLGVRRSSTDLPEEANREGARSREQLEVQTLGAVHVRFGDDDLVPQLHQKWIQRFIWFYLLALELRTPGSRISRTALGDELLPGMDRSEQLGRVRNRLSELRRLEPRELFGRVQSDNQDAWIDLAGCSVDVRRVLDVAARVNASARLVSDTLLEEIERVVAISGGEFLPGWNDIEQRATGAKGVAGDVVNDVRNVVAAAHLQLLAGAADNYLASQRPDLAIHYLEEALRRAPEREDVALTLLAAYEQAGQRRNAARLRKEFGLGSSG